MTISHYLVSWIQVAGFITALFGFFYLSSTEVLGTKSIYFIRPLLPAFAVGLSITLFLKLEEYISNAPPMLDLLIVRIPIPIALGFIFFFLFGFMLAIITEQLTVRSEDDEFVKSFWQVFDPIKSRVLSIYVRYKGRRRKVVWTVLAYYLVLIIIGGLLLLLHWIPFVNFIGGILLVVSSVRLWGM